MFTDHCEPDAGPLPRGRHGLPRETVTRSQRQRILAALVEQVALRGYTKVTISDVVRSARVSRETFYEQFRDKDTAYDAAYREIGLPVLSGFLDVAAGLDRPIDRVRAALTAYFEGLAAHPDVARCFLLERPGRPGEASDEEAELRRARIDAVMAMTGSADRFACEAFIGMIRQFVFDHVAAGRTEELPQLVEPLVRLVERQLG